MVKLNHLSYVVAVVGAGVPQEPAVPSLKAFFILYRIGVQLAEGVIVDATVPQVSAPGVCADKIVGMQMNSNAKKKMRIGDSNLIRLDLV